MDTKLVYKKILLLNNLKCVKQVIELLYYFIDHETSSKIQFLLYYHKFF